MSRQNPPSSQRRNALSCLAYGVGHENEGVSLLVQMGSHRVLLDCGLADIKPFQTKTIPKPEVIFCSHAHRDHAQGLLALHQAFPKIPIYASEVTVQLLPLNWLPQSSQGMPEFFKPLKWRSPIQLAEDLTAELFPAGHLPGAAAIILTYKSPQRTYKILYTGDFSLSNLQLVEGLSVEALRGLAPDVLIVEGSYGTTRHPHRRQQEKQLMERIDRALSDHRSVILPVPIIGLGQEILKLLRSHHQFTGRDLDIWVDGNVAQACDVYLQLLPGFPLSVQNFAKHQPLFWDERICPRMRRLTSSKRSNLGKEPCIVLTDDIANLEKYCVSGAWSIFIPESLHDVLGDDGDRLLTLENEPYLRIETYLLAEHSDGRNTTQLIHNLRPQHVIFVHGSPLYLADLTNLEELQSRYQLHSPGAGTLVELPIGDKFIQPAAPTVNHYEGEVTELNTTVTLTLPHQITQDPRWSDFADTGLIEARWQGEELVLRGLSQRELFSHSHETRRIEDFDCCRTCIHYRNQRCWNSESPLYNFKVIPEGYCPVFEPIEETDFQ